MGSSSKREEYNKCMIPYISGSKPKEQRKLDFCAGAKICSGKAKDRTEAERLCSLPKEPKADKDSKKTTSKRINTGCPVKVEPMSKWINKGDSSELCRSCLLPPVIQWYTSELKENKHAGQAQELADIINIAPDPLQICKKLDIIKSEVGETLRERLKEFDCSVQTYEPSTD